MSRTDIRSLLRKAGHGNVYAYAQAAEAYFDMLSEYLYLTGATDAEERTDEIQSFLATCWARLGGIRHVADFESLLNAGLELRQPKPSFRLDPPHQKLAQLEHGERFLLAARLFERWSYKSLSLSMRLPKRSIGEEVMKLKCRLVGIETNLLKPEERHRILRVSEALEGKLPCKSARQIDHDIANHYHALHFKAEWLAYRCELVDFQQGLRLEAGQRNEIKARLCNMLKAQPQPSRPRLLQTVERTLFAGRGA